MTSTRLSWIGAIGLLAVACLAIAGWAMAADEQQPANALRNGSFEREGRNAQPAGWRNETWAGQGKFEYASVGQTGTRSVSIASQQGADVAWATNVPVEPFSHYRLSAWIKTEDVQPTN